MKNLHTISLLTSLFLMSNFIFAQSFEETNFPDITTTPSASRSANFVDVNGDGWDDVFITNGPATGALNMLYLNNGDGSFTTVTADDIVLQSDRSDGASFADVDNDGDLDCVEVTYGYQGVGNLNHFYRNNGGGSFTREPANPIGSILSYSEMPNWVDVNNDHFLDLYVTNSRVNRNNLYFENQGDGNFIQRIDLDITSEDLKSRSADWVDYDDDGDCDLFITNEDNLKNSLFRNDGSNNFTQITNLSIVTDNMNSAGSSWADIDNDGDFDLFVANWDGQNNQLFINNGGTFVEQTTSVIATDVASSFGSTFGDIDNDGDLDLFVCNAYLTGQLQNFVYLNNGVGVFTRDTSSALANHSGYTFGAAFGDYDNDGWLDIVLANTLGENQENSLFHNTGSGNNWVKIRCVGTTSNTSAVGTKVRLRSSIDGNDVWQTRKISATSGTCSQNSYTVHFGLKTGGIIDEMVILWPSGLEEIFSNVDTNSSYGLIEGTGVLSVQGHFQKERPFAIYPIPSNEHIKIDFAEARNSNINVEIYDLTGKVIFVNKFANGEEILIRKGGISAGHYLVKLYLDDAVYVQKIIFN